MIERVKNSRLRTLPNGCFSFVGRIVKSKNSGKALHNRNGFAFLHTQLKKTPIFGVFSAIFGGSYRARTCDPLLVGQLLSQLS